MFINLSDLSNANVKSSDRRSLVVILGILCAFRCGGCGRLGSGSLSGGSFLLRFLVLLGFWCTEFFRDAFAEGFEFFHTFRKRNDASLLGVNDTLFTGCQSQQGKLLRNILSAHFTGEGQSNRVEQILSLDATFLGHFLHVLLVGLGERALFLGARNRVLEGFHWIFGIRQGEFSGSKLFQYRLGEAVKVSLLYHVLRFMVFEFIKGCRKVVSQDRLGVDDGILGSLHSLPCQGSSGKGHVDQFQIALGCRIDKNIFEFELILDEFYNCLQRQHLHVLLIDPSEFLHVKDRRGFDNAMELKGIDQFVAGENLIVRSVVPSQKRKVIDHGIRQKSIQSELVARGSSVTLRKLLLVLSEDQGTVSISGSRRSERIQYQSLSNSVGQVLLGTNDSRNSHEGVIDGDAKVVHRNSIRSQQNKVTNGSFSIPGNGSTDGIVNDDSRSLGNLETNRVGFSGIQRLVDFLLGGVSPPSIVTGRNACGFLLLPHDIELLLGAKAAVGLALL
mmetsp:Transcript_11941/g.24649  ORF Transcript_11941/g.24649 Transcript_11941/m.24649 type:complete len:503 (+) Transcript_11941:510-2018(+)